MCQELTLQDLKGMLMEVLIRDAHACDAGTIVRYNLNLARESEGVELERSAMGEGSRPKRGGAGRG